MRRAVLQQILARTRPGRRPTLRAIVDLTSLEKRGKFKAISDLIHILNGKRRLQLVIVYLEVR